MRTLAIGDIHGCLRAFDLLLELIQPQPVDTIITLGDHVDRGPDSKGVLDRLIELQCKCKLIPLKGNHDIMMMRSRGDWGTYEDWLCNGGKQALQSYDADPSWSTFAESVPAQHWQFLESCIAYHESLNHFFVHANAYVDIPLDEQPDHMLYWEHLNQNRLRPHENGKIMICGHSSQRSGMPLDLGFAICIDTWVYGDGWLTGLDVMSGRYWQASQSGGTRSWRLENG